MFLSCSFHDLDGKFCTCSDSARLGFVIYRDVGTSPPRELSASRAKLDFEIEMAGQPGISLDRMIVVVMVSMLGYVVRVLCSSKYREVSPEVSEWCNITVSLILISAPPFLIFLQIEFLSFATSHPISSKPLSVAVWNFRLARSSISQVVWKHSTLLDSRWDPSQGSIAAYHHNQSPRRFFPFATQQVPFLLSIFLTIEIPHLPHLRHPHHSKRPAH